MIQQQTWDNRWGSFHSWKIQSVAVASRFSPNSMGGGLLTTTPLCFSSFACFAQFPLICATLQTLEDSCCASPSGLKVYTLIAIWSGSFIHSQPDYILSLSRTEWVWTTTNVGVVLVMTVPCNREHDSCIAKEKRRQNVLKSAFRVTDPVPGNRYQKKQQPESISGRYGCRVQHVGAPQSTM